MKSALSSKLNDGDIIVLDTMSMDAIKTKSMVKILSNLNVQKTALLVMEEKNDTVEKSTRNIIGVKTAFVNTINVIDILKFDKLIVTKLAVEKIQEVYV
jgi:large subunit ribosomal protein L4